MNGEVQYLSPFTSNDIKKKPARWGLVFSIFMWNFISYLMR